MSFKTVKKEIKDSVAKSNSKLHSSTDLIKLTHAMINDKDYEFTQVTSVNDQPVTKISKPVEKLRKALVPSFKELGLDKTEAIAAADKVTFTKDAAEALAEVNMATIAGYLDTGRALKLPMTTDVESAMSIHKDSVSDIIYESKDVIKDPITGKTSMVPNGKKVKTKKHKVLKVKNKTPKWLKKEI